MKMVGHQAQGMRLSTGLGVRFAQCGEKPLPILALPENLLPPVATIHQW